MSNVAGSGVPDGKKCNKLTCVAARLKELAARPGEPSAVNEAETELRGGEARPFTAEQYLESPCSTLPLPFSVCGGSTAGASHIAGEGIIPPAELPSGAYCRVIRRLGDMQRMKSERYSVRQLFISEDADDMALCGSLAAEAHIDYDLAALIQKPYYDERLCAAVHDRATGACVCAGVACRDCALGEAWIELLMPYSPGDEALKLLINELLRRMASTAKFVTACAAPGSAAERALRSCGFSGGDIWVGNQTASNRIE